MSRSVYCAKLHIQAEGLDRVPYPGELGQRIYQNISKSAWEQWIHHQTILINEYRLSTLEPTAQAFLKKEMEKFLFSEEAVEVPAAFTSSET